MVATSTPSNGVRKGPGPFKLNLTRFARSLPSLHQLLPEYACIELGADLAKTTETSVPELATGMAQDAMDFHNDIDTARSSGPAGSRPPYELHPIAGFDQPTWTTARIEEGKVVGIRTILGTDERGDATVPRLSATSSSRVS